MQYIYIYGTAKIHLGLMGIVEFGVLAPFQFANDPLLAIIMCGSTAC